MYSGVYKHVVFVECVCVNIMCWVLQCMCGIACGRCSLVGMCGGGVHAVESCEWWVCVVEFVRKGLCMCCDSEYACA